MSVWVFDTETTGFVQPKLPPEHPSQPHLVQLGGVLYDDSGHERASMDLTIKPEGWEIPSKASDVHGITPAIADRHGIPLIVALALFSNLAKLARHHVGHNIEFDMKVMAAAFHRVNRPMPAMNPRCTKDMADPILKLPPTEKMINAGFGHKFKPPTLTECVRFFFDEQLVGAHSAVIDARACGRVYFELLRRTTQKD